MKNEPPVIIIRHWKERKSKCSVQPLVGRQGFIFREFLKNGVVNQDGLPALDDYLLLYPGGEELDAEKDADAGLLLIDATWRYAEKIRPLFPGMEMRSVPDAWRTAYPRRQQDAPDPARGLASIEALFAAFTRLGRDNTRLLDDYYWREEFLEKNSRLLKTSRE